MLKVIIFLHVLAGISALISGAAAMLLKKAIAKHRIAGKIYFWNMTYIFVSGVGLSLYRDSLFFLFISFFVYHQLVVGLRALKLKNLHKGQQAEPIDWIIDGVTAAACIGFIGVGTYWLMGKNSGNAIIPIVFGIIGLRNVYQNYKRFKNPSSDPTHWLQVHISGMIGSYTGAATAFLVNQGHHIPVPGVVLWFAPTVIFTPLIISEIRKIRRKVVA